MAVSLTMEQFSGAMFAFSRAVDRGVENWTQNACRVITKAEILITPYDTGKAKSNWVASLNAPRSVDRNPLAPGKAAEQPTFREALSVIRVYRTNDTFYLTNSLGYVVDDLNRLGKSRQAAAGFFQRAFRIGVNEAERFPFRVR